MTDKISNSFITEFDTEVKMVFQDKGNKLANTVRTVRGVKANKYTFQLYGKGEATEKSRHSKLTYMNVDHNTVDCYLKAYYAAEPVDDIDTLQQNYDEKRKLAETCAMALGRKSDNLIKTAAYTTTNTIAANYGDSVDVGWTLKKVKKLRKIFGQNYIFDYGGRNFVFTTTDGFNQLLDIDQFANSRYIGADEAPFKMEGLQGKEWMGFQWYTWDSLDSTGGNFRNIAFNENCLAHAIGLEPTTKIVMLEESDDWLVKSKMFMNAVLLDAAGVVDIRTKPDA